MKESKHLRIMLWNAVSISEQLGGSLIFKADDAQTLAGMMGEESERFTIETHEDGTVSFRRAEP